MKKYKSHKTVEAVKIVDFGCGPAGSKLWTIIGLDCPDVTVSQEYMDKHKPKVGGYYVRYADGYESFSPAEAFEAP